MTNEQLVHRNGALGGQTKINVQLVHENRTLGGQTMTNERLVHGNGSFGGQTEINDEGYQKYYSRSSTAAEGNGGDQVTVLR